EGDTPLLHVPRLARELGLERLHVKNDTMLPTGSLKDRSVTVALTHARVLAAGAVGVASSGNHAASVAAYAAPAGPPALLLAPSRARRGPRRDLAGQSAASARPWRPRPRGARGLRRDVRPLQGSAQGLRLVLVPLHESVAERGEEELRLRDLGGPARRDTGLD